jgi:hypothetical protein
LPVIESEMDAQYILKKIPGGQPHNTSQSSRDHQLGLKALRKSVFILL